MIVKDTLKNSNIRSCVLQTYPKEFIIDDFKFDVKYNERIIVKSLMDFIIVLEVSSSDNSKLFLNENSLRLLPNQEVPIDFSLLIPRQFDNRFFFKRSRLAIILKSDIIEVRVPILLNELSNEATPISKELVEIHRDQYTSISSLSNRNDVTSSYRLHSLNTASHSYSNIVESQQGVEILGIQDDYKEYVKYLEEKVLELSCFTKGIQSFEIENTIDMTIFNSGSSYRDLTKKGNSLFKERAYIKYRATRSMNEGYPSRREYLEERNVNLKSNEEEKQSYLNKKPEDTKRLMILDSLTRTLIQTIPNEYRDIANSIIYNLFINEQNLDALMSYTKDFSNHIAHKESSNQDLITSKVSVNQIVKEQEIQIENSNSIKNPNSREYLEEIYKLKQNNLKLREIANEALSDLKQYDNIISNLTHQLNLLKADEDPYYSNESNLGDKAEISHLKRQLYLKDRICDNLKGILSKLKNTI